MADYCKNQILVNLDGISCPIRTPMLLMCDSLILAHATNHTQRQWIDFTSSRLEPGKDVHYYADHDELPKMAQLANDPYAVQAAARRAQTWTEFLSEEGVSCYVQRMLTCMAAVQPWKPQLDPGKDHLARAVLGRWGYKGQLAFHKPDKKMP